MRPFVYDDGEEVSLRFDIRAVQSAMHKHLPFELVFSYTRLMMGFLLFRPEPRDILIIGLGGGSLSKYCYRHVPEARIVTVEINEDVIALRDQFGIPPDDERFTVVHADGAEYVADCYDSADVILLDGYDADGVPDALCSQFFFNRCAQALRDDGVLVSNADEAGGRLGVCEPRLRKAFGGKLMAVTSDSGFNQILFALKGEETPDWETLRQRAVQLEASQNLNFQAMALKLSAEAEANPAFRPI
ncbi:hypothetical protein [Methylogaea oryzae]|uniref:spermine/spermidine synthase domain-containing protein n=1 Tax=Methylogaea oryzae TaxID=1295382 RepID=UPI0006D107C0|nr:hypothetical protein [Methylogaea oryzae]